MGISRFACQVKLCEEQVWFAYAHFSGKRGACIIVLLVVMVSGCVWSGGDRGREGRTGMMLCSDGRNGRTPGKGDASQWVGGS